MPLPSDRSRRPETRRGSAKLTGLPVSEVGQTIDQPAGHEPKGAMFWPWWFVGMRYHRPSMTRKRKESKSQERKRTEGKKEASPLNRPDSPTGRRGVAAAARQLWVCVFQVRQAIWQHQAIQVCLKFALIVSVPIYLQHHYPQRLITQKIAIKVSEAGKPSNPRVNQFTQIVEA